MNIALFVVSELNSLNSEIDKNFYLLKEHLRFLEFSLMLENTK